MKQCPRFCHDALFRHRSWVFGALAIVETINGLPSALAANVKILGIDPGVHGGLAIVVLNDGAAPQLINAIDIPIVGTGAKERVDVLAIRNWIARYQPVHAYIERAQAMPKQGIEFRI